MDGDGLLSAAANPTGDGEGPAKRAEIAAEVAAAEAQRSNAPSSEEAAQYLPAPMHSGRRRRSGSAGDAECVARLADSVCARLRQCQQRG